MCTSDASQDLARFLLFFQKYSRAVSSQVWMHSHFLELGEEKKKKKTINSENLAGDVTDASICQDAPLLSGFSFQTWDASKIFQNNNNNNGLFQVRRSKTDLLRRRADLLGIHQHRRQLRGMLYAIRECRWLQPDGSPLRSSDHGVPQGKDVGRDSWKGAAGCFWQWGFPLDSALMFSLC